MNELRRFILESHFSPRFAKAVYESLSLLEAVNINKDFLIREAGSPERFSAAKSAVQNVWKAENMDAELNQKTAQKVLNILYLMEIRKPGFTDAAKLHSIHDLALHNMLDTKFLNLVNSDSTPEQADEALKNAVEHQEQQQKAYPGLSAEEEAIWNRVKVYHEFPDGFRWVYAVDEKGNITSYIPSSVTGKTMNHCGNSPRAGSDDQYWELRDANGKAYLTIILNKDGELEESKSWGNQVNKYRRQIQPYVKWFLMDKVNGVGHRYDYGYSTHTNYGVKDFMGDDPEFVDYVTEFKPALLGNTEEKILFWHGAVEAGVVTKEQLKKMFVRDLSVDELLKNKDFKDYKKGSKFSYDKKGAYYGSNVFGANRFEVLCASCDGCPFTPEELKQLILEGDIGLEEFVNYNIHLLTPDLQKAFVEYNSSNFDDIVNLAEQVASFKVDESLVEGLINPIRQGDSDASTRLLRYLASANPPDKVSKCAHDVLGDPTLVTAMFPENDDEREIYEYERCLRIMLDVIGRFSDLKILPEMVRPFDFLIKYVNGLRDDEYRRIRYVTELMTGVLAMDTERGAVFIKSLQPNEVLKAMTPIPDEDDFEDFMSLLSLAAKTTKLYGPQYQMTKFPDSQVKLIYLLNLGKEGIRVPGMEKIASTVATRVKTFVSRKEEPEDNECSTYLLGLSASPEACDMLDTGELGLFLCMCERHGPYDIFYAQGNPEIIARGIEDIKRVHDNPSKKIVHDFGEDRLFNFLNRVSGSTPTPEFNDLILGCLYLRATLEGSPCESSDAAMWFDMEDGFKNLAREKFVTIPVEEWPKWVKLLGSRNFLRWYIVQLNPDTIYEDERAMGCIIRALTGHNILCDAGELSTPGNDEEVHSVIGDIDTAVNYATMNRLRKVIAARLSQKVEDGSVRISYNTMKELGSNGMLNPRAYRIAMERNTSGDNGEVDADTEITPGEVWKLIRSPLLPRLVCNTLTKYFTKYAKHTFDKSNEYYDERRTAIRFSLMVDKLNEKSAYYQVMKACELVEKSGILNKMTAFRKKLATARENFRIGGHKFKGMGYQYEWYYTGLMVSALDDLITLVNQYKDNPIPEPKTKKGKRKASDGTAA